MPTSHKLQESEKTAIVKGYLAGEKLEVLAALFACTASNVRALARQRGAPARLTRIPRATPKTPFLAICFKCTAGHNRAYRSRGKLRPQSYCVECHTEYVRNWRHANAARQKHFKSRI